MIASQFDFLTSNRFWALILGSASTVLVNNFGNEPWYVSLGRFLGYVSTGFIAIRTVDRATEVLSPKEPAVPNNENAD